MIISILTALVVQVAICKSEESPKSIKNFKTIALKLRKYRNEAASFSLSYPNSWVVSPVNAGMVKLGESLTVGIDEEKQNDCSVQDPNFPDENFRVGVKTIGGRMFDHYSRGGDIYLRRINGTCFSVAVGQPLPGKLAEEVIGSIQFLKPEAKP